MSDGVFLLCCGFSCSGQSAVLNFSYIMITGFGLLIGFCVLIAYEKVRYLSL